MQWRRQWEAKPEVDADHTRSFFSHLLWWCDTGETPHRPAWDGFRRSLSSRWRVWTLPEAGGGCPGSDTGWCSLKMRVLYTSACSPGSYGIAVTSLTVMLRGPLALHEGLLLKKFGQRWTHIIRFSATTLAFKLAPSAGSARKRNNTPDSLKKVERIVLSRLWLSIQTRQPIT